MLGEFRFIETVDPTAVATVLLALVTAISLLLTARSLRYTKTALQQTQEEIEESHRPVLVPVVDATQRLNPDRADSPTLGPHLVSRGRIWIPLENIGSGPALDIGVSLAFSEGGGEPTQVGAVAGLGAERLLPVEVRAPDITHLQPFAITVDYRDVSGKPWRTTARFAESRRRYESISIDEGPGSEQRA
jgi:hypothetical protein